MLVIVQVRLTSSRFPGKVLTQLLGKPMLCWLIERLQLAAEVDQIIIATSNEAEDDPIEAFSRSVGLNCYRGSLHDVADRLLQVAQQTKVEAFVRVSGDSPLLDPSVVDRAIKLYKHEAADLVTNTFVRTFPKGQSVEVLNTDTFAKVCGRMTGPSDKEHVTPPYYRNPENFHIISFTSGLDAGSIQLSVDTEEDIELAKDLIKASDGRVGDWKTLVGLKLQMRHEC